MNYFVITGTTIALGTIKAKYFFSPLNLVDIGLTNLGLKACMSRIYVLQIDCIAAIYVVM